MALSSTATTPSLSLSLDLSLSLFMAPDDKSGLLEIPGASIYKESVLVIPGSLTSPPSKRTAWISTLQSPTPPTSCDPPLLLPAPIATHPIPRASYHAITLSRSEYRTKEATFTMGLSSKEAAGATSQVSCFENRINSSDEHQRLAQSTPPPLDGTSSTLLPTSVDTLSPPSSQDLSHETVTSSESELTLCTSTTEEECNQTLWEEIPAPRRPTARLVIRSVNVIRQADGQGVVARRVLTYDCESLPYSAGLQPHAYVDNHKYATRGKRDLAEDLYAVDEFMEEEDHAMDESKSPKIFRRLMQKKKVQKFMTFNLPISRRQPTRFPVGSRTTNSQLPAMPSPIASFTNRYPGTANHLTPPNPPPPFSPPPPYATISGS